MNKFTRFFLTAGILLLAYGYLCRALSIYFFWDSKAFGWISLMIAFTSYLFELYKKRKIQRKKTIWIKIAIGLFIFGLFLLPMIIYLLKTSEAYLVAISYLKTDDQIRSKVGNVKRFGLITTGQVNLNSINGVQSGKASFDITINGDKRYKDITILLKKNPETDWEVISLK
jgi:hypothetical protein